MARMASPSIYFSDQLLGYDRLWAAARGVPLHFVSFRAASLGRAGVCFLSSFFPPLILFFFVFSLFFFAHGPVFYFFLSLPACLGSFLCRRVAMTSPALTPAGALGCFTWRINLPPPQQLGRVRSWIPRLSPYSPTLNGRRYPPPPKKKRNFLFVFSPYLLIRFTV